MNKLKTKRKSVYDRILHTASDLFYREGIRNVGIDRIIAESGVAKMSLYNHFKSKDALIEAWLRQEHEQWCQWLKTTVEQQTTDPTKRLLAIFDALREWFEGPDFRGCAFMNASIELANPDHPGYRVALEHQQSIYQYILQLAQAAEVTLPEQLARQLLLLVQGAIVVALMEGSWSTASQAKKAAVMLIQTTSKS
ncbi:TetR family transcriptional regulator protein [Tolypothrix tenuis PCC 7101]|uniref:TetR family transcriptional regulator protein n=1 Tax=Tolypothrix tenuis PCC 7101 TaxID=231146 RepID=A0A1Z4N2H1_9CYAN|nr:MULTISPECIES: TetR/AcrR family transcriptional regulator [unclassified Tolypothrix]MBD2237099.1 TetR/AcrR family transcriptional regulator [Aulosira sp. FACHB-113]BAY91270.1 TetR family transcriptional regulator protein [Microchaete diplosiphon NIES-3275]BAY99938.1 TetR family transcriptional regulator protein [Tolypothrix tenuis PCC 7101]BAZ76140.1 TetR family transcriptional regulator protein [Aulosira laxa NIES-50]EKF04204.1 putative TetR family transcription regulator [Tolypothrix sp. P